MTTYFGCTVAGSDPFTLSGRCNRNNPAVYAYTCPGTGTQNIDELGALVKVTSGSANCRIALYNTDGTFICQGDAEIAVSNTGWEWKTHTSFVDQAGSPITPTITGGTDYCIAVCGDGANLTVAYSLFAANGLYYKDVDYTGGFPATLSGESLYTPKINIRCGVTAAPAGGLLIPVAMYHYINH